MAIKIDPNYANAYINMGSVLEYNDKYEEAIESYRIAIKIDPKNANAYSGLGIALKKLYKYEEALDSFLSYLKAIEVGHRSRVYY